MRRLPLMHCTQSLLNKLRGECSGRVRIFQELFKELIYNGNFIEPNLAKVGVEGSNPFARSNDFNDLGDAAFAAQSGLAACVVMSVLIGTVYFDGKPNRLSSLSRCNGNFWAGSGMSGFLAR
jgi:hypothetical protein